MTGKERAKKIRLEKSIADVLRERMHFSWPKHLFAESGETGGEDVGIRCTEHDSPHSNCGMESWSVHGRVGGREEENEESRFGIYATFFRHAVRSEGEESLDADSSTTFAAALSWVIVDHEEKKYYRFSETDYRSPLMMAYLVAHRRYSMDEYFLQALSEQFSQGRLPLPDRVVENPTSLRLDTLDLQYGENRLMVIPKQKESKSAVFPCYKLHLSGTTFETGDLDPRKEVKAVVELTLQPTQPPVLHGEQGVVKRVGDWTHDMFHFCVPHCTVVDGSIRIMRVSDNLEIACCSSLKGSKLCMDHKFGFPLPRNIQEDMYLQKQRQKSQCMNHMWNMCTIRLDNETEDLISVVFALERVSWKAANVYVVIQSGTTGITICSQEGVEFSPNNASQYRSDATGILFTTQWSLTTPFHEGATLEVTLDATFPHQEFVTLAAKPSLWLGTLVVSGKILSSDGTSVDVTGNGFLQSCGKYSLDDMTKLYGILRDVSTARMEDMMLASMTSPDEIVSGPAASATSTVKTLMNLQGQTMSDAHLVMFTVLLGTYGYIFHNPMKKKEVLEVLDWYHGKWLGYFGRNPMDVKTVMLRAFMLRELTFVLKNRCASWIPAHVQAIDLVMRPSNTDIDALVKTEDTYEKNCTISSSDEFGEEPNKLDLSQLGGISNGTWIIDSTRGTRNFNSFMSAQGVDVLWRSFLESLEPTVSITVDEEKQLMQIVLRASFFRKTDEILLNGKFWHWHCSGRGGTLRSRACVLSGGMELYVETILPKHKIERKWYTFEDDGKTMVEVMRLYDGTVVDSKTKQNNNKNSGASAQPIAVCVRYFTLSLEGVTG